MQVAIDARYIREKPSGIGTYVQALVDRLPSAAPQDGFLFWAHPRARRPLSPEPNAQEIVVRPGPNSPLPLWLPRRYAPFDGIDVFHSPHNLMPRGVPCPTVVTIHDMMAIERPRLHLQGVERIVKRTYYPHAVRRALAQAARIIVPTEDTADRIRRIDGRTASRVHVIHEAADPCFRPAADLGLARRRAQALTGTDAPYLLVVGANSRTKRHHDAVAAFTVVPPPWHLVLLQRQGADARLRALAHRLGVAGRTVWLRRVGRDDVVALMQAAGALVQPSVYEGFGLPIVEAMACGCPVVASDLPVFREVTGGAAIFATPGDPASLARALSVIVAAESRRRDLAAAGLERARQLSWDRAALDTLAVYREAADAGRSASWRTRSA